MGHPNVKSRAIMSQTKVHLMQGKHFRRCNDYRKHSREAKKRVGYTQVGGNGETPKMEHDIV